MLKAADMHKKYLLEVKSIDATTNVKHLLTTSHFILVAKAEDKKLHHIMDADRDMVLNATIGMLSLLLGACIDNKMADPIAIGKDIQEQALLHALQERNMTKGDLFKFIDSLPKPEEPKQ